jgi:hypothetical protein
LCGLDARRARHCDHVANKKEQGMKATKIVRLVIAVVGVAASTSLTGCQVDTAGLTLPSPHYLKDDVQHFAPGPDFKLANEAAALDQARPNVAP